MRYCEAVNEDGSVCDRLMKKVNADEWFCNLHPHPPAPKKPAKKKAKKKAAK